MKKIIIICVVFIGAISLNMNLNNNFTRNFSLNDLIKSNMAYAEVTVEHASPLSSDCTIGVTVLSKSFSFQMERTNCIFHPQNTQTCVTESCLENLQKVGGALIGVVEGFTRDVWNAIKLL